jgi:hypothetical protein
MFIYLDEPGDLGFDCRKKKTTKKTDPIMPISRGSCQPMEGSTSGT